MKRYLHKRFGWFECRFHPFDAHDNPITCRWCGKKYKVSGYPYINATLTPL